MSSTDIWETKYRRAPDCAYREIEGEVFVVSSKTGGVHLLNAVGTFIWSLLDGNTTVARIAEAVTVEFDVDRKTARGDVLDFITEIRGFDLVEISE